MCFSCLLFSSPTLAKLFDQEKREFIENLAQPLPEQKIFYRWDLDSRGTDVDKLLEAGELTQEIYKTFWNKKRAIKSGPGVYFAVSYPILDNKDLEVARKLIFEGREPLSDPDIVKIVEPVSLQIQTISQAENFSDIFEKLPKSTVTRILNQVLPDIERGHYRLEKLNRLCGRRQSTPGLPGGE